VSGEVAAKAAARKVTPRFAYIVRFNILVIINVAGGLVFKSLNIESVYTYRHMHTCAQISVLRYLIFTWPSPYVQCRSPHHPSRPPLLHVQSFWVAYLTALSHHGHWSPCHDEALCRQGLSWSKHQIPQARQPTLITFTNTAHPQRSEQTWYAAVSFVLLLTVQINSLLDTKR